MKNYDLYEMDRRVLLHPFTELSQHREKGPNVIEEANHIFVRDARHGKILDGAAGLWCVNAGYGRQEIARAMYEQALKLPFSHSFTSSTNEPSIRLAEKVLQFAPSNMSKVFFGNSGSDANDTNVKIVWFYNNVLGRPKKKKIIARRRAYHGVTVAAGSLTGLPHCHLGFDLPIPQVLHTEPTYYYREAAAGMSEEDYGKALAAQLDAMIMAEDPETVAAFIAEPVMGTGGVLTPPANYFEEIQKVLRKHQVLMIADEVITGFGRLGSPFGSQKYRLTPDLMTLAKGLTSGYQPMSATLLTQEIADVLEKGSKERGTFGHGFTYSAHPVAAAAGLANLEIIEREGLIQNAADVGSYLIARLREELRNEPFVGDVRGAGLMTGVELVADPATKKPFELSDPVHGQVAKACYEQEKLIVRPLPNGHTLGFSPPLVISRSEADDLAERFVRGLRRVTDERSRARPAA